MKKVKDYLTLVLAAVAFVMMTKTATAQSIQTLSNETIWQKLGRTQTLETLNDAYVFSYLDCQYSQLQVRESIIFLNEEEMNNYFLKMKEIMELPAPKGNNKLTMEMGDLTIIRPKNMLGIPYVYVFDGNKFHTWGRNENNQVLKKLNLM